MIGRVASRLWTCAAAAVVSMVAMLAFPTVASAHFIDPQVDVTPVLSNVSISVPPRLNYASYKVTVTNNTGVAISGLWLFGVAKILPSNTIATFKESSAGCTPGTFVPWAVKCDLGPLAKNAVRQFTITFLSPTAGDQMRFGWAVSTLPPSLETGAACITLVDQSPADIAAGFETIVPQDGGTFYTGVDGGGGAAAPGSAATKIDPFTTTVIVPAGITTTATVAEAVVPSSCSPNYGQCYETRLTIPGAFDHLTIYLRIDVTRLSPFANLPNAVIYYQHLSETPTAVPACGPGLPASGRPCIESRLKYTTANSPTVDWRGDWEFKIQALDNGRYIN